VRRLLPLFLLCLSVLPAHDPITTRLTWAAEIAPIVYRHCQGCHQPGGPSFSLRTYAEARPWAVAIREQVTARHMPPWGAVKGFGAFRHDPSLTQEEITLLTEWVNGGAPEGDARPHAAPAPPWEYAQPEGRGIRIRSGYTLRSPAVLSALAPATPTPLQVRVEIPGHGILPLLWLHEWDPQWRHAFVLAEPLTLPAGAVVRIFPTHASVTLWISPVATSSSARPRA